MEIITEIHTDNLLNIMKTYNGNVKTFCDDIESNYKIFEDIINILLNYGFDLTYLLSDIHAGGILILDDSDIKELSLKDFKIFKLSNKKYLAVEY